MDIVSKYTALLGQQKLKESFVKDLELVLSRKNPNIEKGKLNFIRYSEMKNWSVRELFGEDLEQADRALINKVYHMLFDIGSDFESVIRMLYSFRNGPKSGIKVADPEDNYEWTNKDGNEKYSTKNLPNMDELNKAFTYVSASPLSSTWYWSSTESSQAVAWYVVFSSGLTGTGNKHIGDMVRTVIDF